MLKTNIKEKGSILIITSLTLVVLLILGAYFLAFIVSETKISRSQVTATQSYYLAEAGVNEAIWKLKNSPDWMENFETSPVCNDWSANFSRQNTLLPSSSYQVEIQNLECAKGEIVSTSTIQFVENKNAQRVVKAKVFKAFGSLTENSPFFTGGTSQNIDISSSIVNLFDGNIFSNNNINIKNLSRVNVFDNLKTEEKEGNAFAVNNINLSWFNELNAEAVCSKNICQGDCSEKGCPPGSVPMPMVDFDSNHENSYKEQAISAEENNLCSILCNNIECSKKCVLSEKEFHDLLWQTGYQGTLTLNNKITYITGSFELRGGRELIINGTLLADKMVDIGSRLCWTEKGQSDCGFNQITINNPDINSPSGILTKGNMDFGLYSSSQDIEINGLIYSSNEIRINSCFGEFNIIGGILARKISLTSLWAGINIFLDNDIILKGIWAGPKPVGQEKPPYSPIITIDHWEESY